MDLKITLILEKVKIFEYKIRITFTISLFLIGNSLENFIFYCFDKTVDMDFDNHHTHTMILYGFDLFD